MTGSRERATTDWSGVVRFDTRDGQQRGCTGGDGTARRPDDYDKDNTLTHSVGDCDPVDAPNATVATGLPKRQWRAQNGYDLTAPSDSDGDEWHRSEGDRPSVEELRVRGDIEAALQQASVPRSIQERVLYILDDETGRAWSWAGGYGAAVVGVLAALGRHGFAREVRETRDLSPSVERLEAHAVDRGLVEEPSRPQTRGGDASATSETALSDD
jgi:hypothetical protein